MLLAIASGSRVAHVPCILSHIELRVMLEPAAARAALAHVCGDEDVARGVLAAGLVDNA